MATGKVCNNSQTDIVDNIFKEWGVLDNVKKTIPEWKSGENIINDKLDIRIDDNCNVTYFTSTNLTEGNINIPDIIGDLSELTGIYINENAIGEIPLSILKLDKLYELFLPGNKLTGNIPENIGDMKSLQEIYIPNNNLSGYIPSSITKLDLVTLFLQFNSFRITDDVAKYIKQQQDKHGEISIIVDDLCIPLNKYDFKMTYSNCGTIYCPPQIDTIGISPTTFNISYSSC
tara:strand:+ start:419 stop:1111 length:693 start_codon:yes stop_codon:yes gene_type:complete